jgi:hypothetical protein
VQECYHQIMLNEPAVEYEMRMELAEYLTSIILFGQATKMFKLAADSTDELPKKEAALQKMIWVAESQAANLLAFKNKMHVKEFFIRIPTTFNKDEMFTAITSAEAAINKAIGLSNSELIIKS